MYELCKAKIPRQTAVYKYSYHTQGTGFEAYNMTRQAVQGSSNGSGELNALQRLATAGAEPLAAVGRAVGAHLVHSLGSTTSVAITGGLGVLRLGVGKLPSLAACCSDVQVPVPSANSLFCSASHS